MASKMSVAKPKHWSCQVQFILILAFLSWKVLAEVPVGVKCGRGHCYHGVCKNESLALCVCHDGWTGASCHTCGGRVKLIEPQGHIVESHGNYSLDTKCSWLISGIPNTTIRLRFNHFATECSWDHLYIYDGNSVYSKLVAVLSGLVISESQVNKTIPEVTAHSGSVYLHFYSDAAYNMSGFNISYTMTGCPYECSGHGECDASMVCTCNAGWRGAGCDIPECRNNCNHPNGECVNGMCRCDNQHRGDDCSVPLTQGVWQQVDQNFPTLGPIAGRASHKTVVYDNKLWVASGDDFSHSHFQEMASFNFGTRMWQYHSSNSPSQAQPTQRYGHSLVAYRDKLYMFGGLKHNVITNELWEFDTRQHMWQLRHPVVAPRSSEEQQNEVIGVVGHTAHVIDDTMYAIFGHSPIYGYMNTVQECLLNSANLTWTVAVTSGAIVKGGYGHSSVYDQMSGLIYVHAGYHSESSSGYLLSDSLYSYDPLERSWRILRGSGQFKYLHSAVIISGLMLVFGGNTHNDTSISRGAKCYSTDFLAYSMECDRWYTLPKPNLRQDISRFGHTANVHDGAMYVFGGFNGLMLNDLFKYLPGQCDSNANRERCLRAYPGVLCVWASDQQKCMTQEEAEYALNQKVISSYDSGSGSEFGCPEHAARESDDACPKLKNCQSCLETSYDCTWCQNSCAHIDNCRDEQDCKVDRSQECATLHNCPACHLVPKCQWTQNNQQCNEKSQPTDAKSQDREERQCKASCYNYTHCEDCTDAACMWCSNQRRCVESNSYVASFPYGQCMEWTTQKAKCSVTRCQDLQTCEQCQKNPACGWCDDGQNVGLGACMEGGADGPMEVNGTTAIPAPQKCPQLEDRWFFVKCPVCQCNGHSTCLPGTEICEECLDNTDGLQCQHCKSGYFGQATNGGNCSACECNGQTDICDTESGECHCRTRGVTGEHCEMCDEGQKYMGNPQDGGTCYYNLVIDFQFTFNLSKPADQYFTQINFMNTPTSSDRDVDFNINCSSWALLNITVKSNSNPVEQTVVGAVECGIFKAKFSHKKFDFGGSKNTTFYVYLYNFQTPFSLHISFSQFPQIDLVHFFVTFFSCFLSLLLIAAILWKVKQRYDLARRRQRMFVEMEQMASRPFGACAIEISDEKPHIQTKKEPPDVRASRRKKQYKPSPVAMQPLHGHKAAMLTLIVKLPQGDEEHTPPGQAGLALGCALVTLGHPRKVSMDHSKGDKVKMRKSAAAGSENCI